TLIMDADVVFSREFLRRLVGSTAGNALLIDRGFADTGEEGKVYVRDGRGIALGKKVGPEAGGQVGEGIGVFKSETAAGAQFGGVARASHRPERRALRVRGRLAPPRRPPPRRSGGRDRIAMDRGGFRGRPPPGAVDDLPEDRQPRWPVKEILGGAVVRAAAVR